VAESFGGNDEPVDTLMANIVGVGAEVSTRFCRNQVGLWHIIRFMYGCTHWDETCQAWLMQFCMQECINHRLPHVSVVCPISTFRVGLRGFG